MASQSFRKATRRSCSVYGREDARAIDPFTGLAPPHEPTYAFTWVRSARDSFGRTRRRRKDSCWHEALDIDGDRGDHVDCCHSRGSWLATSFGLCAPETPSRRSAASGPDIGPMKVTERVEFASATLVIALRCRFCLGLCRAISAILPSRSDRPCTSPLVHRDDRPLQSCRVGLKKAAHPLGRLECIDISKIGEVQKARAEFFQGDFPASTLVQVAALADPAMKVEIECIAHIGAG